MTAEPGAVRQYLIGAEALDRNDLLPGTPEYIAASLGEDLTACLGVITKNVLGFGRWRLRESVLDGAFKELREISNHSALL